jgi:hypothetical protein
VFHCGKTDPPGEGAIRPPGAVKPPPDGGCGGCGAGGQGGSQSVQSGAGGNGGGDVGGAEVPGGGTSVGVEICGGATDVGVGNEDLTVGPCSGSGAAEDGTAFTLGVSVGGGALGGLGATGECAVSLTSTGVGGDAFCVFTQTKLMPTAASSAMRKAAAGNSVLRFSCSAWSWQAPSPPSSIGREADVS